MTVCVGRPCAGQLTSALVLFEASLLHLYLSDRSRGDGVSELIVVTVIVAAEGGVKVPKITSREDLTKALNKLGALRSGQVQSFYILHRLMFLHIAFIVAGHSCDLLSARFVSICQGFGVLIYIFGSADFGG